jgi:uncharacterized membrane protein YheB (UPF0754 family)
MEISQRVSRKRWKPEKSISKELRTQETETLMKSIGRQLSQQKLQHNKMPWWMIWRLMWMILKKQSNKSQLGVRLDQIGLETSH